ncbi:structural protein [Chiqui virus]|uniref:structural protein n=1 Tax=Chiqui virus TaxID=2250219 RepID=UPI000DC79B7C|nr:structural protein [Chiqui virus]AWX66224.1 structural protein [Chiqui virus]
MPWEPTAELSDFSSGSDPIPSNVKDILDKPTLRFEHDEKTGKNTITPTGMWKYVRISTDAIARIEKYKTTRNILQPYDESEIANVFRLSVVQPSFQPETLINANKRFAIGIWTTLVTTSTNNELRELLIKEPELLCWNADETTSGKLDNLIYRVDSISKSRYNDMPYVIIPSYGSNDVFAPSEEPFNTYWFMSKDSPNIVNSLKQLLTDTNSVMHSIPKYGNPHIISHKSKAELGSHVLRSCIENLIQLDETWGKYVSVSRECETLMTGTIEPWLAKCRAASMMPVPIKRTTIGLDQDVDKITLLHAIYDEFAKNKTLGPVLQSLFEDTTKLAIPTLMLRVKKDNSMYPVSKPLIPYVLYKYNAEDLKVRDLIENRVGAPVTSIQIPNGELIDDDRLVGNTIQYGPAPLNIINYSSYVRQNYDLTSLFKCTEMLPNLDEYNDDMEGEFRFDYVRLFQYETSESYFALSTSCRFLESISRNLNEFRRLRRNGELEIIVGSHQHLLQALTFKQKQLTFESGRIRLPDEEVKDRHINNSTIKLLSLFIHIVVNKFLVKDGLTYTDYDKSKLRTVTIWGAENEPLVDILTCLFPTIKVIGKGDRAIGSGNQRTILGAELETDTMRNVIISDINQDGPRTEQGAFDVLEFTIQIVEKLVRQSDACAIKVNHPHPYVLNAIIQKVREIGARAGTRECRFVRCNGQNHYTPEMYVLIMKAEQNFEPKYCDYNHPASTMYMDPRLSPEEKVDDKGFRFRLSAKIPNKDDETTPEFRDMVEQGGMTFAILVNTLSSELAITHLSHYCSHVISASIVNSLQTLVVGAVSPSRLALTTRVEGLRRLNRVTMPSRYGYGKISSDTPILLSPFRETTIGSLLADASRYQIYKTIHNWFEAKINLVVDIGSANHKLISLIPKTTKYVTYDPINVKGMLDMWNVTVNDMPIDYRNLPNDFPVEDGMLVCCTFSLFAPDPVTGETPDSEEQLDRLIALANSLIERTKGQMSWAIGFTLYSDKIFEYIEPDTDIPGIKLRYPKDADPENGIIQQILPGVTFGEFDIVDAVSEEQLQEKLSIIENVDVAFDHPSMLDYVDGSVFSRCVSDAIYSIRAPLLATAIWTGTITSQV